MRNGPESARDRWYSAERRTINEAAIERDTWDAWCTSGVADIRAVRESAREAWGSNEEAARACEGLDSPWTSAWAEEYLVKAHEARVIVATLTKLLDWIVFHPDAYPPSWDDYWWADFLQPERAFDRGEPTPLQASQALLCLETLRGRTFAKWSATGRKLDGKTDVDGPSVLRGGKRALERLGERPSPKDFIATLEKHEAALREIANKAKC